MVKIGRTRIFQVKKIEKLGPNSSEDSNISDDDQNKPFYLER